MHGEKLLSLLKKNKRRVEISLIEPGESSKDLANLDKIIKPFFKNTIKRNTHLLSFGGGVVTDIGGFIASILLRGIPQVSIPTTLLAQTDASIGGKNGMNMKIDGKTYKNMVGTFSQPKIVLSDIDLLKTLPEREWRSGLGEIAKYSLGWGTPTINQLKAIKTPGRWPLDSFQVEELVKTISICQKLKLDVIKNDPDDKLHIRETLNFGHTIGHAVEGASSGKLSHGEAVSIGLVAASFISTKMGFITEGLRRENILFLKSLTLPTIAKNIKVNDVKMLMSQDKKGGTFVLLKGRKNLVTNVPVPETIITEALKEIIT